MFRACFLQRVLRNFLLFAFCGLAGCATQPKKFKLVQERAVSLVPLMRWTSTQCRVEARPTQPMWAMYRAKFGEENQSEVLTYTWKARKFDCELTGLEDTKANRSFHSFAKTALCTLLQPHWVNSPFEDLQLSPRDITEDKAGRVHIQTSMLEKDLGIFLDPDAFKLETKTKGLGILRAEYAQNSEKQWVPARLEQLTKSGFVVDSIEYDSAIVNGRHMIKSFWISAGGQEHPLTRHAQLIFSECRGM